MPAVPRIRRAVVDEGQVYRPAQGIPVIATMEYAASGIKEDVEALAIAWTRECAEGVWLGRGGGGGGGRRSGGGPGAGRGARDLAPDVRPVRLCEHVDLSIGRTVSRH